MPVSRGVNKRWRGTHPEGPIRQDLAGPLHQAVCSAPYLSLDLEFGYASTAQESLSIARG